MIDMISNAEQAYLYNLLEPTSPVGMSDEKINRISNRLKQIYKQHETFEHPKPVVSDLLPIKEQDIGPEV